MPPRSGPRLVSRRFIHAQLRDRIGARIDPKLLDSIEADLGERFEQHVANLQAAHDQERELRAFHALEEFTPVLRPKHLEVS